MRSCLRWIALTAVAALVLPVAMVSVASAQYREFTGKVDKINSEKMIVDNRMGDKLTFEHLDETKVSDTSGDDDKKEKWRDLKKDDWVTVKWKMMDNPRKAYEVIVLPEREEAGEEM
jgi:hypothetical protein